MVGEKAQNSEKYPFTAKFLVTEFQLQQAKGSKISKLWLKTKMNKIESCYGKEANKCKASNNWFQRFKQRHNISLSRRTNKKNKAANDGRETIQWFHRELRKADQSKRRRTNAAVDKTYGRWLPKNRLNVDQVLLPFLSKIRHMKLQETNKTSMDFPSRFWPRQEASNAPALD